MGLENYLLKNKAKNYRLSRNNYIILFSTTRKRAIGPAQRYQLLLQPVPMVPLASDQPNGGQLASGGGSNRFQCVSIGTGLNHHPVPNDGDAIGTG